MSIWSLPPFHNPDGFRLPGLTKESRSTTQQLLEDNHQRHDIFFNESLFHNHFVHHVLAAYSMGASPERLKDIYQNHSSYLKPMRPRKLTLTRENWTQHVGDSTMWPDFMDFFDKVVKEDGIQKSLVDFGFHPKIFPRLFAGVLHPLIHLGYGIEFQLPLVVSEGLAQAAVEPDELGPLINGNAYFEASSPASSSKTISQIFKELCSESQFDILKYHDEHKFGTVVGKSDLVKQYINQWHVGEENVKEKTEELYKMTVLAYAATQRPNTTLKRLDFFLMHCLTSVLFVEVIQHHLSLAQRVSLIKAHYLSLATHWISQGRPALHLDTLLSYQTKIPPSSNPWLDVAKLGLEKEVHVIKVLRSLMKADQLYADFDGAFLKAAQLTLDSISDRETWSFNGMGWDEEWVQTPQQPSTGGSSVAE